MEQKLKISYEKKIKNFCNELNEFRKDTLANLFFLSQRVKILEDGKSTRYWIL